MSCFHAHPTDPLDLPQVPTAAATLVDRVFDRDDTCPWQVRIVAPIDVLPHLFGGEASVDALEQAHGCPGVGGDTATFVQINVRQLITDHFIARLRMHLDSDLIGHRAAGTEQGGLLAKEFGRLLLQGIDGGILTEDIVPHPRLQHCFEHLAGRLGDGVASNIDHLRHRKHSTGSGFGSGRRCVVCKNEIVSFGGFVARETGLV